MAAKKECPSCAMEIPSNEKSCPICGYEFTEQRGFIKWTAILLLIVFFLLYFVFKFF